MEILDIEKGRFLATTFLKKEALLAAYLNLSSIERSFDIIYGGQDGIDKNTPDHLKLPEGNYNIYHVRIAIVYLASFLSVGRTAYIFTISNISAKTKRDNYIHETRNKYNIRFHIALNEMGIQFQENGEFKQHLIDIKNFTLHSCPESKRNWLFLDSADGSSFKCEYCGRKIVHYAKGKAYDQFLKLYLGNNNIRTKITNAEFDVFFKNNLAESISIQ